MAVGKKLPIHFSSRIQFTCSSVNSVRIQLRLKDYLPVEDRGSAVGAEVEALVPARVAAGGHDDAVAALSYGKARGQANGTPLIRRGEVRGGATVGKGDLGWYSHALCASGLKRGIWVC